MTKADVELVISVGKRDVLALSVRREVAGLSRVVIVVVFAATFF